MLINVRGTHGSGRSTTVRTLLQRYETQPIYDVLFGLRAPEAYRLRVPGVETDIFVIGPYLTQCGGADSVQSFELISKLILKYSARGSIVFEGALVSSCYGRIGSLLETYGSQSVILFLNTPLAVCIARVNARRAESGNNKPFDPKGLIQKHRTIERLKAEMIARGMRVITASSDEAPAAIVRILQSRSVVFPDKSDRTDANAISADRMQI